MQKIDETGKYANYYLKLYLRVIGHGFMEKYKYKNLLTQYIKQNLEYMPFVEFSFVTGSILMKIHKHYEEKLQMQNELLHSYKNYDCNMKWVTRNKEYF